MAGHQPVDGDREALLCALQQAGVEFVLLGGAGIESYGERYRTKDVDVLPERSTANLQRLATALNGLACRLVVEPADRSQDVPLPAGYFTAASIARVAIWNLGTRHGDLGIVGTPSGFPGGYEQLRERARPLRVADTRVEVQVAALADIEHSKRTAGRPKDLDYLQSVGRFQAPVAAVADGAEAQAVSQARGKPDRGNPER